MLTVSCDVYVRHSILWFKCLRASLFVAIWICVCVCVCWTRVEHSSRFIANFQCYSIIVSATAVTAMIYYDIFQIDCIPIRNKICNKFNFLVQWSSISECRAIISIFFFLFFLLIVSHTNCAVNESIGNFIETKCAEILKYFWKLDSFGRASLTWPILLSNIYTAYQSGIQANKYCVCPHNYNIQLL